VMIVIVMIESALSAVASTIVEEGDILMNGCDNNRSDDSVFAVLREVMILAIDLLCL